MCLKGGKTNGKREQDGHDACRQADYQHVAADGHFDAGAGAVQRRGQRVRQPHQRAGAHGGVAGLPGAEPDDRRGDRHGRGRERAAFPRAGRKEQGPGEQGGRKRRVPGAGGLRAVPGVRPVWKSGVHGLADPGLRNHRDGHGVPDRLLRPVLRHFRRDHVRAADAVYRPHLLHDDYPGRGRDLQHHFRPDLHLHAGHGRNRRGAGDGAGPDRGVRSGDRAQPQAQSGRAPVGKGLQARPAG